MLLMYKVCGVYKVFFCLVSVVSAVCLVWVYFSTELSRKHTLRYLLNQYMNKSYKSFTVIFWFSSYKITKKSRTISSKMINFYI